MKKGTIVQIKDSYNRTYKFINQYGYIATLPEEEGYAGYYSVQFPYSNEEERIANQCMVTESDVRVIKY